MQETQLALNSTRETVDNQARAVSNDNKINSKMLMQFETGMSNFSLEVRNLKDSVSSMRKMVPNLSEKIMNMEARHDEIIRALRELGQVMQVNKLEDGFK